LLEFVGLVESDARSTRRQTQHASHQPNHPRSDTQAWSAAAKQALVPPKLLASPDPNLPVSAASRILFFKLSVLEKVREDVIRALKAGERDVAGALRLVVSELQKDVKEGNGDELAVLRREHKRRVEAATQFENANRPDLAHKETAEAHLIAQYLPPDLSDEQLDTIVKDAVAQTGASSLKDMGAVMKLVMEEAGGLVDGKRASDAVRAALGA
jgi:uncharacterized protein